MFFDRIGAGMGPGMGGGGASAFTSPGMNPQSLAALMAMFGRGMGGGGMGGGSIPAGGPTIPMPPARAGVGPPALPIPGVQQPGAAPGFSPSMTPEAMSRGNSGLMALLALLSGGGGGGVLPAGAGPYSGYGST